MPQAIDRVKIFHQIHPDGYKKHQEFFMKHNLAMRILFDCLYRAWFGNEANKVGLIKGEFLFSKTEYGKLLLEE